MAKQPSHDGIGRATQQSLLVSASTRLVLPRLCYNETEPPGEIPEGSDPLGVRCASRSGVP